MSEGQENLKPSEMNPEDLPGVRAFQDEFTREFLQSTEETREGYYPFLSGTGKYTMDFPAQGVIDSRTYFLNERFHEEIPISIMDDSGFGIHIIYYSTHKEENIEDNLYRFKKRLGYEGDFTLKEFETHSLYYAYLDGEVLGTYAGYLLNEKGLGGIEIVYDIDCTKTENRCEGDTEKDTERVIEWMNSIRFVHEVRD